MNELETKYFEYLKNKGITDIGHKSTVVKYQDGYSGEWGEYSPSFTISYNGVVEHVEVQPASKQFPRTEYLYAQNSLNWRMISSEELAEIGEPDNIVVLLW